MPLGADCNTPPQGEVGASYDHFLTATGGTPPYFFTVISGSLPPGLNLDSATGEITGIPAAPGTYPFSVAVTDSE